MAVLGTSDWSKGFPFSASRLRPGLRDASGRLRAADVTSHLIPDPGDGTALDHAALRTGTGQTGFGHAGPDHGGRSTDGSARADESIWPAPDPRQAEAVSALPPTILPRRIAPRAATLRLLPIAAFLWDGGGHPPVPRTRPEHAVIWLQSGLHRLRFPRQDLALCAGELRFIPAGTAFASLPHPEAVGHVLLIPADLARRAVPAFPEAAQGGLVGDRAPALAMNLRELADETRHEDRLALDCHLGLLATRLARLAPASAPMRDGQSALPGRSEVDRFIDAARRNLDPMLTLAERAEAQGLTHAALDRACLAFRGRRAIEILNDLRIERAAGLLRDTLLPIAQIALASGHVSLTHFTRAFVVATGRTPQTFRNQLRAVPPDQLHL